MSDTFKVLMPLMGEGVHEATLVRWFKQAGQEIKKDEPLIEVSTDKVDTEIPSPATGTISECFFKEGEAIKVNAIIATINASAGSQKPAASVSPKAVTAPYVGRADKAPPVTQTPGVKAENLLIPMETPRGESPMAATQARKSSPLVRKIAKENGVSLDQVIGTGVHNRITKADILKYLESSKREGLPREAGIARPEFQAGGGQAKLPTTFENGNEYLEGVKVRREKMTQMRRLIAQHMVQSVRTSPHVTTTFEIDMEKIVKLRETHKEEFLRKEGFNLTYTAFITHAVVQIIKRYPILNVSVDGEDILYKDDINIGVAVAIENGLIVPVLKRAQYLNLAGVARGLNDLVIRSRSKKLLPDDVKGGTFSITNPGLFGCLFSNPIINQPQVGMLGVGAIVKRPMVINDMIAVRPMCYISITFDHRVVDGEGGARFLRELKELIENYSESPVF